MNGRLPASIDVVEVGPRDGLQDEPTFISTDRKLEYIGAAINAGARRIEIASFVNPKRVPQMADAEDVIAGLSSHDSSFLALVLNERGLDRAIDTGIGEINVVLIVTDTFSERNQGFPTRDAMSMWQAVATRAHAHGIRCGVTLSAAFGCPFEGLVPHERVIQLARQVADTGADEISLADTIGAAVPTQTESLVAAVLEATRVSVRVHLHNSRNTGLANAVAALAGGATALDASLGGLGGCPFAPGATGNIATEDLVHMLHGMGVHTGFNIEALLDGVAVAESVVGHSVPGMLAKAGQFPASHIHKDAAG